MLTTLTIKNVVIIESLTIDFRGGFCALTGETGAGKSILLDSLGLALGMRAETGLVRKGSDKASVSAVFELPADHEVFQELKEQELDYEPGSIVLRRVLNADGGSKAFINDQPVSVTLLRQIGNMLVEIHGQFETYGLLDPKTHKGMLDDYAGIDGQSLAVQWQAWKEAEAALETAQMTLAKAREDEDYLRQSLEDLDTLNPEGEGEEERLSQLREQLMNREQILEGLNTAHHILSENTSVNEAFRALDRIADKTGSSIQQALDAIDRADAELQEAVSQIQSLSADLEDCDHNLESIDDRLFSLKGQARKHECSIDDLPQKREELAQQLTLIEKQDDHLADLIKAADQARRAFEQEARQVSAVRQSSAARLDDLVAKELPPLKLEKARFVTQVDPLAETQWGPGGIDSVRFLVATNPGSAPGPLDKIASGGEMARFMLALKVIMAEAGIPQTMIFDEVDTGIGGATASAVGERLARLAQDKQILVVTHAPQVAARANHHWIVMKESGHGDNVQTTVIPLPETTARREEIARMLAGAEITQEARAAADKLLETGS